MLAFDAGSGIRRLGMALPDTTKRVEPVAHAPPHGPHRRAGLLRRALSPGSRRAHLGSGVDDARPVGAPRALSLAPVVPGPDARPRLHAHAARRSARYVRARRLRRTQRARLAPGPNGRLSRRARARHRHVPDGSRTGPRRHQLSRAGRMDVGLRPRARRRRVDPRRAVRRRRIPRSAGLGPQFDHPGAGVRRTRRGAPPRHVPPRSCPRRRDARPHVRGARRAAHPFALTVAVEGLEIPLPVPALAP